MVTQLRDYRIAPGRQDDFVAAWTRGVLPLRRAHGFEIEAWTVDGQERFVWLLSFDGTWSEFEARDAAYYASPERSGLDPDPAQWIAEQRLERLTQVTDAAR